MAPGEQKAKHDARPAESVVSFVRVATDEFITAVNDHRTTFLMASAESLEDT